VCILSVRAADSAPIALHHVSYMDLGKPPFCVVPMVVRAEDEHTHSHTQQLLELTCMQDMLNGQNAIQQFHVPLGAVVSLSEHSAGAPASAKSASADYEYDGSASQGYISSPAKSSGANPFDVFKPPPAEAPSGVKHNNDAGALPAPAASNAASKSLMGMLVGGTPKPDNFPYFALAKPSDAPPAAQSAPAVSSTAAVPTTIESNAAAAHAPPPQQQQQQGLKIIEFLRKSASQGEGSADLGGSAASTPLQTSAFSKAAAPAADPPTTPLPANINPFDEMTTAAPAPAAAASSSSYEEPPAIAPAAAAGSASEMCFCCGGSGHKRKSCPWFSRDKQSGQDRLEVQKVKQLGAEELQLLYASCCKDGLLSARSSDAVRAKLTAQFREIMDGSSGGASEDRLPEDAAKDNVKELRATLLPELTLLDTIKDTVEASIAASMRKYQAPAAPAQVSLNSGTMSQLKAFVSSECKKAVESALKNDTWKDEVRTSAAAVMRLSVMCLIYALCVSDAMLRSFAPKSPTSCARSSLRCLARPSGTRSRTSCERA
jgi:hypothetical protein